MEACGAIQQHRRARHVGADGLRPDGRSRLRTPEQCGEIAMSETGMRRTGWALTGFFTAFMLFDIGIKLAGVPIVEQTMREMGYPPGLGFPIGVIEAVCLVLYLMPRSA